ncbi:MAG: SOS response-associated peptidase [Chloroflexota bacterium]|nr:SOS response-associated peptidase [Chloroflexota bacterium]
MCGRFGLVHPEWSETRFGAQMLPDIDAQTVLIPRFNIAPTQDVLTVAPSKRLGGRLGVKSMRWGLTAQWALTDRAKPRPINIKSEGILDRPAYRRLLSLKRCVIIGDGFFEWRKQPGRPKQPHWIGLRNSEMFGFAGLWDAVKDGDEWLVSCAILTTTPNSLVATLHDRQPVILMPEQEDLWLSADATDVGELLPVLAPLPETLMVMYPVSRLVNDVKNEGPELRRYVEDEPRQTALL